MTLLNPQLKSTQEHRLSPKALLSTAVLQMGCVELEEYVDQMRLENPLIELEANYTDSFLDKLIWLSKTNQPSFAKSYSFSPDDDQPAPWEYGDTNAYDFTEELSIQLCCLKLDQIQAKIARFILASLDDNGYFNDSIPESAELLQVSYNAFAETLGLLQSRLEPPGICAQSVEQ